MSTETIVDPITATIDRIYRRINTKRTPVVYLHGDGKSLANQLKVRGVTAENAERLCEELRDRRRADINFDGIGDCCRGKAIPLFRVAPR